MTFIEAVEELGVRVALALFNENQVYDALRIWRLN